MNDTKNRYDMRTSAVDRSKIFLMVNVPLFIAFAIVACLLAGLLTSMPLLSFRGMCVFWLSFVLAWVVNYCFSLETNNAD